MPPVEYDAFFDLMRLRGRHVELSVSMDGKMDVEGRPGRKMVLMRVTDYKKDGMAAEALDGIHDCGRAASVLSGRLVG